MAKNLCSSECCSSTGLGKLGPRFVAIFGELFFAEFEIFSEYCSQIQKVTGIDVHSIIGERTTYEKKGLLERNKSKHWLKNVSAYANGEGGTLLFGITDDDRIVG